VIVIDTSAIMAVLRQEPEAQAISVVLERSSRTLLSAVSAVEATMVASRFKTQDFDPDAWLDDFIALSTIEIEAVSVAHAQLARVAFRRYGKGTGHGAGLNFGDCFSYALAKSLDVPLLYKGSDFAQTDIASALA
jgi:ribonuclease VapC